MKYVTSQLMYMVGKHEHRRNLALLARFFVVLIVMVTTYSVVFHFIMRGEGQDHSWVTGFYWTLAGQGKPLTFYLDDIVFENGE